MNFDFTESENRFFDDLRKKIDRFAGGRDLESKDTESAGRCLWEALVLLSEVGYLDLGFAHDRMESGGDLRLLGGMEVLAAASPSLFLAIEMSTRLFGRIIARWGSRDQADKYLLPLRKGKLLGAVALSEKAMNVDNDPLETIGIEDGDQIRVTGRKQYVVNGSVADWTAVVGMFRNSHAIFLVKNNTNGMRKDARLHTLGYDGVQICHLQLDGCRIPPDQVILPKAGEAVLETIRLWENQILSAACLGMMQSSFETAKKYANTHQSGGKPIVAYQEVAFKLAEILTIYQTSQLLAYRAAWMSDVNPKEAAELTLCAKVFCTESAEKIAGQALQILAGEGYQLGNKAECAFRCAKYTQIAGTSTEIARVKIGDKALGYI
jgi:alkylation response protein AidB-like acyl-CoA dehydrogenase